MWSMLVIATSQAGIVHTNNIPALCNNSLTRKIFEWWVVIPITTQVYVSQLWEGIPMTIHDFDCLAARDHVRLLVHVSNLSWVCHMTFLRPDFNIKQLWRVALTQEYHNALWIICKCNLAAAFCGMWLMLLKKSNQMDIVNQLVLISDVYR